MALPSTLYSAYSRLDITACLVSSYHPATLGLLSYGVATVPSSPSSVLTDCIGAYINSCTQLPATLSFYDLNPCSGAPLASLRPTLRVVA